MKKQFVAVLLTTLFILPGLSFAGDNGLIVKKSPHSVSETLDRWAALLKKKKIRVFARVSHSENAKGVGLKLRPTELLIFGNPKLGTHYFTANQEAGIDLPMKAMAWQDKNGQTWLAYNDPSYVAKRHHVKNRDAITKKMKGALEKMSNYAIAK